MLLQPSGVQGGLRNRGNAALGAHQRAEETAQGGIEDARSAAFGRGVFASKQQPVCKEWGE